MSRGGGKASNAAGSSRSPRKNPFRERTGAALAQRVRGFTSPSESLIGGMPANHDFPGTVGPEERQKAGHYPAGGAGPWVIF